MSRAALALALLVLAPAGARGQEVDREVPPPGGIVGPVRGFALGLGVGTLRWDDPAPYDDLALWSVTLERRLWSFVRGRAGVSAGKSALPTPETGGEVDVWVMAFDLQVLLGAEFGLLADAGVVPYVVGGLGSLVTNPTGDGARGLPTRSQSVWSWGGGLRARLAERWEARAEATSAGVRLADPITAEENETDTIHNLRMEGSVQWLF